jgi:hypothetical protein
MREGAHSFPALSPLPRPYGHAVCELPHKSLILMFLWLLCICEVHCIDFVVKTGDHPIHDPPITKIGIFRITQDLPTCTLHCFLSFSLPLTLSQVEI